MSRELNEIDTSKIVIEKGVPKQKWKNGGRVNKWFYVFSKMAIDDSFSVPFEDMDKAKKLQGAITMAVRGYRKNGRQ